MVTITRVERRARPWQGTVALVPFLRDFHPATVWAALTAFAWFAFGMVPLQVAAAGRLGLSAGQASSMMCSVWLFGAVATITLSLAYRQPLAITWSTPALLYLVAMTGRFTLPELLGANLLAGLIILGLGLSGVGGRLLAWLPLPLALGMFAGSIFGDMTRLVSATVADGIVVGATVGGYLLGRWIRTPRVPPLGLAVVAGALAVILAQRAGPVPLAWQPPALVVPALRFSFPAVIAVSLPLVVLSMGLGNVQGLGFLRAQGYKVPATSATVVVGLTSAISALFGGHPANASRFGAAMLAGPEAGPKAGRYWATLIVAALMLLLAVAAGPVAAVLTALPQSYLLAIVGLAILSSFQDALEQAFGGTLRFGAMVAFVVAATPFTVAGLPAACWALVAGIVASLVTEKDELLRYWRSSGDPA
jgi:benzoate membrane transport protein